MMTLLSSTQCYFCEKEAKYVCKICKRRVCEDHYYSGICYACKLALCRICGRRPSVSRCAVCGKLVCRECSVEYQPGIRVCKECASKCEDVSECVKRQKEEVPKYLKVSEAIFKRVIGGVGSSSTFR